MHEPLRLSWSLCAGRPKTVEIQRASSRPIARIAASVCFAKNVLTATGVITSFEVSDVPIVRRLSIALIATKVLT